MAAGAAVRRPAGREMARSLRKPSWHDSPSCSHGATGSPLALLGLAAAIQGAPCAASAARGRAWLPLVVAERPGLSRWRSALKKDHPIQRVTWVAAEGGAVLALPDPALRSPAGSWCPARSGRSGISLVSALPRDFPFSADTFQDQSRRSLARGQPQPGAVQETGCAPHRTRARSSSRCAECRESCCEARAVGRHAACLTPGVQARSVVVTPADGGGHPPTPSCARGPASRSANRQEVFDDRSLR